MTPNVNFMDVRALARVSTRQPIPKHTHTHAREATSNDEWGRSVAVRAKKASAKTIHHLGRKNFNVQ